MTVPEPMEIAIQRIEHAERIQAARLAGIKRRKDELADEEHRVRQELQRLEKLRYNILRNPSVPLAS
jgi:hypothetical protein